MGARGGGAETGASTSKERDMAGTIDPAAGAAPGQLARAIDAVEAIYGPDPEGRHLDIVAAILSAMRSSRAERLGAQWAVATARTRVRSLPNK
jgi:hypothetical protein